VVIYGDIKMSNSPIIHVNRLYHVELDKIIKIVQKKHGSIYVYFNDGKSERPKIAIAKQSMSNLLTVVNTSRIMRGFKPLLAEYEK
jgi:hypothetical protein